MLLAYIPSPSRGVIELGPFELHAYGLMLALGVLVAAKITEKRWVAWGHPGREIAEIFIPVVIAGVVGARVYHLFTGYNWDAGGIAGTVKIWQGGLSIWGAVAGGAIAVIVMARVKHLDTLRLTARVHALDPHSQALFAEHGYQPAKHVDLLPARRRILPMWRAPAGEAATTNPTAAATTGQRSPSRRHRRNAAKKHTR